MILEDFKNPIPQEILFAPTPSQCYRGVDRKDQIVYSQFDNLYQKSKGRFWIPEKTSLTSDAAAFRLLSEPQRQLFTMNLLWQMAADTLQTAGLSERIIPLANNMELRRSLRFQVTEEQTHSDSYNYIVSHMYNDPGLINDRVLTEPIIVERISMYNEAYSDEAWDIESLLLTILAMESVSFVTSFLVTMGLNRESNNALLNVADEIVLIALDEAAHQSLFTNIIRVHKKQAPLTQDGWDERAGVIFKYIYNSELSWAAQMYEIHPLAELAPEPFKAFLEYKIDVAMRGARLKSIFDAPRKISDTYLLTSYNNMTDIKLSNAALQETNESGYSKDLIVKDWPLYRPKK